MNGMLSTDSRSAAASSSVPAAVIHERFGFGDRKNASAPSDVCVSESSENHCIHSFHTGSSSLR